MGAGCGVTWLKGRENRPRAVTARGQQRTNRWSPRWCQGLQSVASIARCIAVTVALAPRTHVMLQRDVENVGRWQQRTNVWRKATNPARRAKRLRGGMHEQGRSPVPGRARFGHAALMSLPKNGELT
jgi:hypothetical protein